MRRQARAELAAAQVELGAARAQLRAALGCSLRYPTAQKNNYCRIAAPRHCNNHMKFEPHCKGRISDVSCQMNEHDAERIRALLEAGGLRPVEEPDGADVLVYNTCTVRKSADDRLAGRLGHAARLKREREFRYFSLGFRCAKDAGGGER